MKSAIQGPSSTCRLNLSPSRRRAQVAPQHRLFGRTAVAIFLPGILRRHGTNRADGKALIWGTKLSLHLGARLLCVSTRPTANKTPMLGFEVLQKEAKVTVTLITQRRGYLGLAGLGLAATAALFLMTNPSSEAASAERLLSKTSQDVQQPFSGANTMCVILYSAARCEALQPPNTGM
jgi:hypothetical protein